MQVTLLQDWVTRQARERPESIAIVNDGRVLTYGELDGFSSRIASALIRAGCSRGDRVCLLMPKSELAIAALTGIYKAGCIYVPLDMNSPGTRLAGIIRKCECRCILTSTAAARKLEGIFNKDLISAATITGWLDTGAIRRYGNGPVFTLNDVMAGPVSDLPRPGGDEVPAHILFTSGSTGEPKGVVITHENVIGFIDWAVDYFGLSPEDRISGHPPLNFDLSFMDIFGAFAAGAQLHLVPQKLNLLPPSLVQWMRDSGLTQWFSVPSLLNYLSRFDVIGRDDLPEMKRILWCGEVFPTPALIYWMERLPHVKFTNLYGPTETTIASSYYTVEECPADERQTIPLGQACSGEELLVLDRDLKPVKSGEEGEIYIGGSGVSLGYWNDPARTAESFLPDPGNHDGGLIYRTGDRARIGDDGNIYYLGRLDAQIKSRGYRIELGEIETVLSTIPYLKESVVVALPTDGFENVAICCAYSKHDNSIVSPVELRNDLAKALPYYMIPSHWISIDTLPRNGNGKIDRRLIRDMFQNDEVSAS